MSDTVIRVEKIGKRYKIGTRQNGYRTLRETLSRAFTSPFRRFANFGSGVSNPDPGYFWALKNVSFEIKAGEIVGIIGRNGAGKTTLLKLLSRITEPTEGRAEIYGRVGSLLEVGTGFHPELTGRENIYLNAAILGLRKAEVTRKFDEIIAFAEVEKFLDTPVKHYSSGMHVRLAFAVAAHLEPEILLVDEVLAVGDAAFQKKCLGKMGDVANEGRTILFVSHNMDAVLNLCPQTLVLNDGSIKFSGNSEDALAYYLNSLSITPETQDPHIIYKNANILTNRPQIEYIEILDQSINPKLIISTWDDILFRVHYFSSDDIKSGTIVLDIRNFNQQRLIVLDSGLKIPIKKGHHSVDCFVPRLSLTAGEYYLGAGLALSNSQWLWRETNLGSFRVHGKDVFNLGRPPGLSRMIFAVTHEWSESGKVD
jgi:lipopolysaccharide transport system ATP-binding protein